MGYFFIIMLFIGLILTIFVLARQISVSRERKLLGIISPAEESARNERPKQLDYRNLIINNSKFLLMLKSLDENFSLKIRVTGIIVIILFASNMIGILSLAINDLAVVIFFIMIFIILTPALLLRPLITTCEKKMMVALPYFIDLTAVGVQAGMTIENSIKFTAEHSTRLDSNLAEIMLFVIRLSEVSGLEEALTELYDSLNTTEMRMFCTALQQSAHYGTSLYENLTELSKNIRELQLLTIEEKIGKLSAKMSVPLILFIMFPITILIAAPGILRIMKNAIF